MKVKVRYFASLRELIDRREEILDVDEGTTVGELLKQLVTHHGPKLSEYIFDPATRDPRQYLQFLIDEKSIANLNGFSTVLKEGSVFVIIPPVGGG